MIDEGYIKFRCHWTKQELPPVGPVDDLLEARNLLFQKKLVGYDAVHRVGYGNISKRINRLHFLISGTQTGDIESLDLNGYSYVDAFDIDKNEVYCTGPAQASSESMTHAAIYQLQKNIGAVVHVHHKKLWEALLHEVPATRKEVSYGTPAMAYEVGRLAGEEGLLNTRIFAMAGHEDGIISFGDTVADAMQVMMQHFNAL